MNMELMDKDNSFPKNKDPLTMYDKPNRTFKDYILEQRKLIYLIAGSCLIIILIVVIIVASSVSDNTIIDGKSPEEKIPKKDDIDVSKLTPYQRYKYIPKSLYAWEYYHADYLIKLCKDHNFTRLYISIGCIETFYENYYQYGKFPAKDEIGDQEIEDITKQLNDINVEVEYVTFLGEDPNDFYEVERAYALARQVKKFAEDKGLKIKALHFDQECGDEYAYEQMLRMYKNLSQIFPVSAILRPYWMTLEMSYLKDYFLDANFYKEFSDCQTLADAVMKVTNYSDLMAYNSEYYQVIKYMDTLYTIAKRHPNNEAKGVIEFQPLKGDLAGDTLYEKYVNDKDEIFDFIYNISYKYGGITIHCFEAWYKMLFCNNIYTINQPYYGDKDEPQQCN